MITTMHVERHGNGGPTVLLESGLGQHSAHWGAVPERVAVDTSVVTYDRPGLGRSGRRRTPLTPARYLAELAPVLARCEPGPLVLVGHSFGGFLIRAFAAARPERVGALLFVDSATENEMEGMPARVVRLDALAPQLMLVNVAAAALGAGRLRVNQERVQREVAGYSPVQRAAIVADQASPRYWLANRAELRAYPTFRDYAVATSSAPVYGQVPLTFITAVGYPEAVTTATFGMTAAEFRDVHVRRQLTAFRELAPGARQVLAERSGHMVAHDQPDLLVAEIKRLVREVRRLA